VREQVVKEKIIIYKLNIIFNIRLLIFLKRLINSRGVCKLRVASLVRFIMIAFTDGLIWH
jgi:hypothetical protein